MSVGRGAGRGKPPPPPSKKLAKILGEDPQMIPSAPSIPPPIAPPAVPETPWYLGEDYALEDITFDDKGGVRAGSLRALVARLTPHGSTGESKWMVVETMLMRNRYLVFPGFPTYVPILHHRV